MLSPQKAADQVGVSRRTIMVAIEAKRLKAIRNNRNQWSIDADDLRVWADQRDAKSRSAPPDNHDTYSDTDHPISISIARLEERLEAAERRAEDLANTLVEERKTQHEQIASLKTEHRDQIERRDTDYQQAMALLREAQRPRGLLDWIGIKRGLRD